ncbi:hypothetical protein SAMN05192574_106349 [Mucilaginibacter gossypiicola]|uniref:Uncharacterized protein n=1 Tax=Mucilaginibacter gossypiicola TaxID=551995 RepID=A0A1H8NC27_9SPHI|nr:hypothetical protein SAMN05192574_106349 [Mucilaginibacter gossypiicola]
MSCLLIGFIGKKTLKPGYKDPEIKEAIKLNVLWPL